MLSNLPLSNPEMSWHLRAIYFKFNVLGFIHFGMFLKSAFSSSVSVSVETTFNGVRAAHSSVKGDLE